MVRFAAGVVLMAALHATNTLAADVTITERIQPYRVSGNTIQDVVKSMKRNGPVSELHGRRALGLADYWYRTNVKTKKADGLCRVTGVSVSMQVYLKWPELSRSSRLSSRDQRRWRQIRLMIERHERHHGRLYRQFAHELQRALARMKPRRDCGQFRKIEKQLKDRYEELNARRNRNYDRGQYKPFNRRLKLLAPKRG